MTDIIEKSFDIDVYHEMKILPLNGFVRLGDCMFRTPVWAKTVASLEEFCFTNGFKDLQNTLLYQPVHNNVQACEERKEHQNIVLLLDVSGSMSSHNTVTQETVATIFSKLNPGDRISLVTYSDQDSTELDGYIIRSEADKEELMGILLGIEIDGCTNGSAGIETAYRLGSQYYQEGWSNQVILITDGDLNFGITEKHGLRDLIEKKKKSGLFLSVIGTGLTNYKDDKLEKKAYVDLSHDGWMFSGRCLRVRPNAEIWPLYLYYYFCLEDTKQFVRNIAVGATMPSINTKLMGEVPIGLPQMEDQQRIASLLSAIDSKIETNEKINDNLAA